MHDMMHGTVPAILNLMSQTQALTNSGLLKTVTGRLKEIQLSKKTNKIYLFLSLDDVLILISFPSIL